MAHILPDEGDTVRFPDGTRVEIQFAPNAENRSRLWNIVQQGFAPLNRASYERQDMSHDEFVADMASPTVVKLISYDADNEPTGYVAAHLGLESATWASAEILGREMSTHGDGKIPYYVTTLVITPDLKATGTAVRLVQALLSQFSKSGRANGYQSLAFFDCSGANHPRLAKFVKWCSLPSSETGFGGTDIEVVEVGREYWIKSGAAGAGARKVLVLPGINSGWDLLDVQHYYRIRTVAR